MSYKHSAVLRFDFKTPEHAQIAANSMNVDDDLKPEESTANFSVDGHSMVFEVHASSIKFLKKAIGTTISSIMLVEQTINEFALD